MTEKGDLTTIFVWQCLDLGKICPSLRKTLHPWVYTLIKKAITTSDLLKLNNDRPWRNLPWCSQCASVLFRASSQTDRFDPRLSHSQSRRLLRAKHQNKTKLTTRQMNRDGKLQSGLLFNPQSQELRPNLEDLQEMEHHNCGSVLVSKYVCI